jgi:hypothetical protein
MKFTKKRVSIFDERSHHVIENKGLAKRTKPNEAIFRRSNLGANRMREAGGSVKQI